MAEGKKSVLLYCDLIHTIEKMDNETAGEFFKHYLRYINDLDPKTENIVVDIAFESVKQNLKRDLNKWEVIKQKRSEAGKKGGRPRKQTEAKKPNAFFEKQTKAKKAVTVNDNVNVNVTVNDTSTEVEDVLTDIDTLSKNYLCNRRLVIAFCENQKIEPPDLEQSLQKFNIELKNKGQLAKTDKDYKSHFLNWYRVQEKIKKEKSSEKKESNGKPKYVGGRQTEEDIIANASNWGVN